MHPIKFRAKLIVALTASLIAASGGFTLSASPEPSVPEYRVEMREA